MSMKPKVLLYFLSLLMLVGCTDNYPSGYDSEDLVPMAKGHYLNVSATSSNIIIYEGQPIISFEGQASSQQIQVLAESTPWAFQGMDSWVKVVPSTGNQDAQVTISANRNPSGDEARTSIFNLNSTDEAYHKSFLVSVTQDASKPFVKLSSSNCQFSYSASSQTIQVEANVDWTLSCSATWLTAKVAPDKKSVTFSVTENQALSTRNTSVTFWDSNNQLNKLEISQVAPGTPPTPSMSTLSFDEKGGTYEVSIQSDVSWTASTKDAWLDITPKSGKSGKTKVKISATPNTNIDERIGEIGINLSDVKTAAITVKQKGLYLTLEPTDVVFSSLSESKTINVSSNVEWSVLEKPDWITLSATKGTGNGSLTLRSEEWKSGMSRKGILKIGKAGTLLTATANLTQKGKYITLSPTIVAEIPSKGGSHTIHIASDDSWTATKTASWMTISKESGTGNVDVKLTAPDYPSLTPRDNTTTFTGVYAEPVSVVTRQLGRYLTVSATSIHLFAKGGTSDVVTINTDATYTITCSDSWFTVQQNGNTFTVTTPVNETGERRNGKVIINMTGLKNGEEYILEIPVIQRKPGVIDVEPFGDDQQWELDANGSFSVYVTGFSSDQNWNGIKDENVSVTLKTFSDDQSWD